MTMTIKELKKVIEGLDDNIKVGGIGYFGEYLECYSIEVSEAYISRQSSEKETILAIAIENPGDEPD